MSDESRRLEPEVQLLVGALSDPIWSSWERGIHEYVSLRREQSSGRKKNALFEARQPCSFVNPGGCDSRAVWRESNVNEKSERFGTIAIILSGIARDTMTTMIVLINERVHCIPDYYRSYH